MKIAFSFFMLVVFASSVLTGNDCIWRNSPNYSYVSGCNLQSTACRPLCGQSCNDTNSFGPIAYTYQWPLNVSSGGTEGLSDEKKTCYVRRLCSQVDQVGFNCERNSADGQRHCVDTNDFGARCYRCNRGEPVAVPSSVWALTSDCVPPV